MARRASVMTACCLLATAAHADQSTGAIFVTVSQGPDDRARIDVVAADDRAREWSVETRGAIAAPVQNLPPGSYRARVTLANGRSAAVEIAVGAGEVVVLHGESTGRGPIDLRVVDRRRVALGTYFDARHVRE